MLEHTADAGIIARGASWAELYANAALGMFSLMADLEGVRQTEERRIWVETARRDREALMVLWLTELLYYLDAEELLFSRFEVEEATERRLRARAFGERIDPERHRLHLGVKAVTRHMLEVRGVEGRYRARILFDI